MARSASGKASNTTTSTPACTPRYTAFAFQHRRASGVELYSNGLRDFTAEDF